MIATLLGGLGLFLLGMLMLTDGLKALAGEALRSILTRFVAGPISGVGWGALVTALVQSSTATTVATVGFVSAGLLTFTQSVGVVFGANLGTTSTGWIVSQLGFKVSLGAISPPLVLAGVALRLLGRGRVVHIGTAVAGFALLFIGIDMLQVGMGDLSGRVNPAELPGIGGSGFAGRALLVGVGFAITIIMQSSSASMAATLAAVASGAIGVEQGAALIIGHNIGTTPTAVIAALGGPAAAKRTALAHVLFNVFAAAIALSAMGLLLRSATWVVGAAGADDGPTALAAFHTSIKLLGVACLLPVIRPFSSLIERIIPERGPRAVRFLAPSVATVGPVALEAARRAVADVAVQAARAVQQFVQGRSIDPRLAGELSEARAALITVRKFIHDLAQRGQGGAEVARHDAILHATDHAERLLETLAEAQRHGRLALRDPVAQQMSGALATMVAEIAAACEQLASGGGPAPGSSLVTAIASGAATSTAIAEQRRAERRAALSSVAAGRLDPETADRRIDTLLLLDRLGYHTWRAVHYLQDPPPADAEDAEGAAPASPVAPGGGGV